MLLIAIIIEINSAYTYPMNMQFNLFFFKYTALTVMQ